MRRAALFLALLATPTSQAWACADAPAIEATTDYFGTCELYVVFGRDRTNQCPGDMRLVAHAGPESNAFLVIQIGVARRSAFWGQLAPSDDGSVTLRVTSVSDTVIESDGDQPTRTRDAEGNCTFSSPDAGPVRIDCSISSDKSNTGLAFVSNRAPDFQWFDVPETEIASVSAPCAAIRI